MVRLGSFFLISDNSGVKKIKIIGNLTRKLSNISLGDLVVGVVKEIYPKSKITFSTIVYCRVIRLKKVNYTIKEYNISFNDNSAVLVDRNSNLVGSRIFGSVPSYLKKKNFLKLHSLTLDLI